MAAGSSTGWMNDGGLIGSGSAVPRSPSLRSTRATLKPDPKRNVSTVVSRTGCGSSPSISPSLVAWAAWSPGHTFIRTVAGKPRAIHTTTRLRSTRRRIGPASTNGRAIARAPYPSPVGGHPELRPMGVYGTERSPTHPSVRDFTCPIGVCRAPCSCGHRALVPETRRDRRRVDTRVAQGRDRCRVVVVGT